jgi:hypothetical protein
VPLPTNCVPFDATRRRIGPAHGAEYISPLGAGALGRSDLSPAQHEFLTGVFAVLAAHGADALTKSCEMVIERFGRRREG